VGGCNRPLKVALTPLKYQGSSINPSWNFEMINWWPGKARGGAK